MVTIVPTAGRVVLYCLSRTDVSEINRRRRDASSKFHMHEWQRNGTQLHVGNEVSEGDIVPAIVIRPWGNTPESACNLKVLLDGNDDYWATSRTASGEPKPGYFHWMDYQKGQAAKTEALERQISGSAGGGSGGATTRYPAGDPSNDTL